MILATAFYKKSDWIKSTGYDEYLKKGLEDWEFWIHLLKKGGMVSKLQKVYFFYRIKELSMLTEFIKDDCSTIKYIEQKHYDFFATQLGLITKLSDQVQRYEGILNGKLMCFFYRFVTFLSATRSKTKQLFSIRK